MHIIIRAISLSVILVAAFAAYGQTVDCTERDYTCKIAKYTQQINADPANDEAYYYRGIAFHYSKNYDRAISDFTHYITAGKVKPEASFTIPSTVVSCAFTLLLVSKHNKKTIAKQQFVPLNNFLKFIVYCQFNYYIVQF